MILMITMTMAGRLSSSYNVPGQLMLQGSVGRGEELEVGVMLMLMLMLMLRLMVMLDADADALLYSVYDQERFQDI